MVWRKGRRWAGRKVFQEAYDAAIARPLAVAAGQAKRHKLGRVRIFTGALGEPGPGQTYALQAIAQEPAVEIEIRWFQSHKGIPGNEVAGKWAKLAASEPDDHGVEWLTLADGTRAFPRSRPHIART